MVSKLAIRHGSTTNLTEISLIGTYIRKRFEIEAEIRLLSCTQDSHFSIDLYKEFPVSMVTKVVIWHGSFTNLAETSLIKSYIRKRFEIEGEMKLLSCTQDSHFTIDLYKKLCVAMVTKLVIGRSASTNLAEILLIETCVQKRFEIKEEIKLLSCTQDSHFTIYLYKELRVAMVTKVAIGHGSASNLAEI